MKKEETSVSISSCLPLEHGAPDEHWCWSWGAARPWLLLQICSLPKLRLKWERNLWAFHQSNVNCVCVWGKISEVMCLCSNFCCALKFLEPEWNWLGVPDWCPTARAFQVVNLIPVSENAERGEQSRWQTWLGISLTSLSLKLLNLSCWSFQYSDPHSNVWAMLFRVRVAVSVLAPRSANENKHCSPAVCNWDK